MEAKVSILTTMVSSIREEIIELSNALALAQSRLLQLAQRVEQQEQDAEILKSRYADLEVVYKEALTSAKWLRVQNAELECKTANPKPDVRESAFQKLKHARKVIRDLLDERGDMKSPTSRTSIRQEDIDLALHGEDSPSTDSSGKTVRLAAADHTSTNTSTSQPSQESQGSDRTQTNKRSASEDSESVASPLSQTSQFSIEQRGRQWRIQYKKPPGTSILTDGPLSISTLENDLNMDDYMMFSLQNLVTSSDISMRFQVLHLHSKQNVACLYDPIFIETRKRSYILDWGHRQTNDNLQKYIMAHKDIDPVFHTFTFPLKEEGWFYIGAQHWTVVDFETIWPLEGKSRKIIINKLFKRSRGEVSKTEIERLLDSGEVVQICVELTAAADTSVSQNFSRDTLGYRTPPHRHDRGVKE